uniref:mitotic-spindle organizing protein 1 isoform X2 n=1 Tax=Myxine glutinosa TaxID=7769 RepID=UPI00358F97A8
MANEASRLGGAERETLDTLMEISGLLNTGLDMETLCICVRLCEQGINPEALANVIRQLRQERHALQAEEVSVEKRPC